MCDFSWVKKIYDFFKTKNHQWKEIIEFVVHLIQDPELDLRGCSERLSMLLS